MPIRWSAFAGLLVIAVVSGCGSDPDVGGSGTHLKVEGVATTSNAFVAPGSHDPIPSSGDPGSATEVSIDGTVTCEGARSTGTGMFATSAAEVCLQIVTQRAVFDSIGTADEQTCSQVYGGPQHATIQGAIDGHPVDLSVSRSDGCGIADWTTLEWFLGPPER